MELLAGLSFEQSMQSRLLSIPVNLLTARAYGLYRDWLFNRGSFIGQGFVQKALLDALAYVFFQIPLYATLVISTGASLEQVLMACAGQIGGNADYGAIIRNIYAVLSFMVQVSSCASCINIFFI